MWRVSPLGIAVALLLFSMAVIGCDWWASHDLELLEVVRHLPMAGPRLERWFGADVKRAEVTFAVDASYPPFAFVQQDGALVGFESDLATELGNRLSYRPRVVNMDAADALRDALAAKKIDAIIAGLSYTPEVTREVAYSEGYYEAGPGILVSNSRSDILSERDLAGKKVVVETGSLGEEEARRVQRGLSGMEVIPMDDVDRVLALVAGGEAGAAILDRPSIPAGSPSMATLHFVAFPLRSVPYVIAVSRRDPALFLAIDRELEAMRADGALDRLEAKWLR